jgi:hypothetical protein
MYRSQRSEGKEQRDIGERHAHSKGPGAHVLDEGGRKCEAEPSSLGMKLGQLIYNAALLVVSGVALVARGLQPIKIASQV